MPESEEELASVVDAGGLVEVDRVEEGKSSPSAVGDIQKDPAIGGIILPKAWAEIKADKNAPEPCETYLDMLVQSVEERLVHALSGKQEAGGIKLVGALQDQQPTKIDNRGQISTTIEHWRWSNCRTSLADKGIYEAPGSIFWLHKGPPHWEKIELPASGLTYAVMAAGRIVWSHDKFLRSSDDPEKRR